MPTLSACVPYQQYSNLEGEFGIAKKLNYDLQNKIKELEFSMSGIQGAGGIAQSAMKLLQEENDNLRRENAALRENNRILQEQLKRLPPADIPVFNAIEGINVEHGEVVLATDVLFRAGSAELRPEAKRSLDRLAAVIRDEYGDRVIDIWGHTDPQPIKSSGHMDNFDLGFKRAHSVYDYFTKTVFATSKERFRLHTAGEHEPYGGSAPSKAEYSTCRRVVLKLGEPL